MAWSPLGFTVESDGSERLHFSDPEFVVRVAASATGGAVSIVEERAPLDTPLHVHEREDEIIYILDGDHVVQVGEQEFHVGPGALVFAHAASPIHNGVFGRGPGGS
jgi:mannose-6-phosphate isomerase-like protein (cupin superfamily)